MVGESESRTKSAKCHFSCLCTSARTIGFSTFQQDLKDKVGIQVSKSPLFWRSCHVLDEIMISVSKERIMAPWALRKKFTVLLAGSLCIFLFNEFLIYYFVIGQCSWPNVRGLHNANAGGQQDESLKVMILADTHLLGPRRGHWFDKLRREWQMHLAFQTASWIFRPEVVFILGDIFDEGLWVNPHEFQHYVDRFHSLFYVPSSTQLAIVVGNHDIGFHYVVTQSLNQRFEKAFNTSSVQLLWFKKIPFVLLNSMAMEQDGCFLCSDAIKKFNRIADDLDCSRDPSDKKCSSRKFSMYEYAAPVLLQHFPLFRESDKSCIGDDTAPDNEKEEKFRENWNCLSKSSTRLVLSLLRPRLIMSGHTHHGCLYNHSQVEHVGVNDKKLIPEYSVASFSWRNRDNPSFYLGTFLKNTYELSKCQMPRESTVKIIYTIGIGGLIIYLFFSKLILTIFRFAVNRIVR